MPHKNRILLYGALVLCGALYAVPQLSGPSFSGLGGPGIGGTSDEPIDDGTFAFGFDAVTSANAAGGVGLGGGQTSSGLAQQLAAALARLERSSNAPEPARASLEPRAPAGTALTANNAGGNANRARGNPLQSLRQSLDLYLQSAPLRGAIVGSKGAVLLLDGQRLSPGDPLGTSGWAVVEVDGRGALFGAGEHRIRADFGPARRGAAPPSSAPDRSVPMVESGAATAPEANPEAQL